jgi:hypothetical protein
VNFEFIPKHVNHCLQAVRTSETSVDNHFTRQYNPEDSSEHHTRRRENLKSHVNHLITQDDKIYGNLCICNILHSLSSDSQIFENESYYIGRTACWFGPHAENRIFESDAYFWHLKGSLICRTRSIHTANGSGRFWK